MAFEQITWDEWVEKYKPVMTGLKPNQEIRMFETYGQDLKTITTWPVSQIWTLKEEDGEQFLDPGLRWINRLGYYACNIPWDNWELQVTITGDNDAQNT